MMMSQALKDRLGFESWASPGELPENLFVWKLFLTGEELPGWRDHRIQRIETAEWPPMLQSIWQASDHDTEQLLAVDIFDCPSVADARDVLLRVLGEFQYPFTARQQQAQLGDVAFVTPGEGAVAFARANLVLLVRTAGREQVAVLDAARALDLELAARSADSSARVVPEILHVSLAAREIDVNQRALLEVEAIDPLDRPLWFKFFSHPGHVLRDGQQLMYVTSVAGSQRIVVYAINANRGVASQEVQFTARAEAST